MLFDEELRRRHGAKLHISGRVRVPPFLPGIGFWESGGKATRSIFWLQRTDEGLECSLPPQYSDGVIRLGQHNLSSAGSDSIWSFTLMAVFVDDHGFHLIREISWLLAFRLASGAVNAMATAFAQQSVSSIAFYLDSKSGELTARTRGLSIPCPYYSVALLLNNDPEDLVGNYGFSYEEATVAVHQAVRFSPQEFPSQGSDQ